MGDAAMRAKVPSLLNTGVDITDNMKNETK